MPAKKPEPIRVSAEGIKAKPVTMNEPSEGNAVNWRALASLPPFQMFVDERAPCPGDSDSVRWTYQFVERYIKEVGEEALIEKYTAWHKRKGYWPDESPLGEQGLRG